MPQCGAESLLEAHEAKGVALGVPFILSVLLDTARGMQYLHAPSAAQPHLLHRDLKPANILMKVRDSASFFSRRSFGSRARPRLASD